MRRPTPLLPLLLLLLLLLLLVLPAAGRAQGGGRPVPYLGVGAGGQSLPDPFQGCSRGTHLAADVRGGVARGVVALEVRVAALGELAFSDCPAAAAAPLAIESGIHTSTRYPFRSWDEHLAADLRLRLGGTRALPLAVSGGAGWLWSSGVPYLLVAAGVRPGGRLRLAVDVERSWYRVTGTEVATEWQDYRPVREVSRRERREWLGGAGVRAGVELPFR